MALPHLKREIGLLQATSINMIDMVGIGPFVTMPLVIGIFGRKVFLWAWVFGAVTALIDGMIWSELGAAYPLAGGSYNFLKQGYGSKYGPLLSFLFVWQTCLQAPLVVASGAIGFAQYFGYLIPLGPVASKVVSGSVVILIVLLLYRNIRTIGRISVLLWAGVIITICWIIISGFTHRQVSYSCLPAQGGASIFSMSFLILLGQSSVKTIYSYLGYYNVCHLGGEIRNPGKNIPRSIFISIFGIAALYIFMNLGIVGVVPWQEAMHSKFIVSTFMERVYGHRMAMIATMLVLWIAFASLFAVVLGYSRVPYAAAADGAFFPWFARLHPTKEFPYISLLFIGALGFVFSLLFKLSEVISAILAMRILVQFVAQAIGTVLLREKRKKAAVAGGEEGAGAGAGVEAGVTAGEGVKVDDEVRGKAGVRVGRRDPAGSSPGAGNTRIPFRMWLYPLPVVLSVSIWLFVLVSTGWVALLGLFLAAAGVVVYYSMRGLWLKEKGTKEQED
ncbi:MAG: APC family permease [Puia sp.]|nr:APC family permease [Puia sp.]